VLNKPSGIWTLPKEVAFRCKAVGSVGDVVEIRNGAVKMMKAGREL